jgi:hypothetical protein
VFNKIKGLFKSRGSEKYSEDVEKQSIQNIVEVALNDLKNGLLDGSYAIVVWDKECGDPGSKPDLQNIVAVIDSGSLTYTGIAEDGKTISLQISSNAQGFLTIYIITRSFLDKLLKRFEDLVKRLGIDPEEVAVIHIASPDTLKFYGVESSTCLVTPIPRNLAENIINEITNEIEKRLRSAVEVSKLQQVSGVK